jgi:hypothetical protein
MAASPDGMAVIVQGREVIRRVDVRCVQSKRMAERATRRGAMRTRKTPMKVELLCPDELDRPGQPVLIDVLRAQLYGRQSDLVRPGRKPNLWLFPRQSLHRDSLPARTERGWSVGVYDSSGIRMKALSPVILRRPSTRQVPGAKQLD